MPMTAPRYYGTAESLGHAPWIIQPAAQTHGTMTRHGSVNAARVSK